MDIKVFKCQGCEKADICEAKVIREWYEQENHLEEMYESSDARKDLILELVDWFFKNSEDSVDIAANLGVVSSALYKIAYYEGRQYKGGQLLET